MLYHGFLATHAYLGSMQHDNYKLTKFVCLSVISGHLQLRQHAAVDRLLIFVVDLLEIFTNENA